MLMKKATAKYDPGAQRYDDDWLCLHRNENLFVGRDWTVETASRMVETASISLFPDSTCRKLREAIAELYGVGPENVFVGNGSDEVLSDLFMLLRGSYDRVSLLDVCFRIYLLLAERFGFRVATMPGDTFVTGRISPNGWSGLAVVDSPNAITSAQLNAESLEALSQDERSFLIWDNVYGEYADDVVPATIRKNVVIVRSFSKFYALAGLRIGYCIADKAIVDELLARKDAFNVNGFAMVMALEALRRQEEFRRLGAEMRRCRDELVAGLQARGFRVHKPAGNFVLASHPAHSGERLELELQKRRVVVRRFPGELTSNHIRITVPPPPVLRRFLEVASDVVADVRTDRVVAHASPMAAE
jgi:histidinol-phosphate aminotransferase